jgi:hypothetical protein
MLSNLADRPDAVAGLPAVPATLRYHFARAQA